MLRLLLVIVLVNGLAPSLGEAVELSVHFVTSGHIAHFEAGESDLGDVGREHGCGPISHQCGCCHSQPLIPGAPAGVMLAEVSSFQQAPRTEEAAADGPHSRLFRPPIDA